MMYGGVNDMQLRMYIDQVFMRYDFNRTGTLNLPELHIFLNELFQMCGIPRIVTYQEAYSALMTMDCNRDGQINKYELFNLFRYMTTPGYTPLPYSYGSYSYGLGGMGMGMGMGGMGGMGMGMGGMGMMNPGMGMGMGGMGMGGMGMGGYGMGGYGNTWSSAWSGW